MKFFRSKAKSSDFTESSECSRGSDARQERRLLRELARRNQEVARHKEQLGKLHNEVARIAEQQAAQRKHMSSVEHEHKVELRNLQRQVEEERAVKHAIEMELAALMGKCNELVNENKLQLIEEESGRETEHTSGHEGASRYGSTEGARSSCLVCCASNASNEGPASSSGDSRRPPDELKKLRGGMSRLGASMEEDAPYDEDEELEKQKMSEYEAKTATACASVKKDLGRLKKWVSWKWRWAAEALKSDIMSKRLEGTENEQNTRGDGKSRCKQCNKKPCVCTGSVVPAVMTAWRAYARAARLEKKALSMITSLEKMVSALPWWIRRVGQRRLLERCFFRWELYALRKHNKPSSTATTDNSVDPLPRKCSACKHDKQHTDTKPKKHVPEKVANPPRLTRKVWGSSGGKREYLSWENQVRQKQDFFRHSGVKNLQSLQASIQKELRELESHLSDHMRTLKEDKTPKGPIWKGSCSSTWEVCNNLIRSLTDARKQLGSADGRLKDGIKTAPKRYRGGHDSLLDIPGGFQQKMNVQRPQKGPSHTRGSPRARHKQPTHSQQPQQHQHQQTGEPTILEVPAETCNLSLDPGASVNVTCPGDGKEQWGIYGGRICSAAQYAEYLREEIRRLKQWQLEHEAEISKELRAKQFLTGDVHPELELCW